MEMPRIIGKISLNRKNLNMIGAQWKRLQSEWDQPIKIAIPGPMTIMDSTYNEHYKDSVDQLLLDLAENINTFLVHLTNQYDVRFIQIDEPIFARKPEMTKRIGFAAMKRVWQNVPDRVYKSIHICCGYTDEVDEKYEKASNHAYVRLADYGMDEFLVNECGVNGISIEDAHDRVPMEFYRKIRKLDIILGVVKVCRTECYSEEEIVERVSSIIKEGGVKPDKLLLAPDCGMALLPLDVARKKIQVMGRAANVLRRRYQSKL